MSYKTNIPHIKPIAGTQPKILPTLNRLSEQEEDEDDGDYDDIEEGCEDDLLDNVSRNTATTSSEFEYHSGRPSAMKFKSFARSNDTSNPYMRDSLRKRNTSASVKNKTSNKSKCVQFVQLPELSDSSPHSTVYPSAELNERHSIPLKKIIFNGTFPIDDPYSSRF